MTHSFLFTMCRIMLLAAWIGQLGCSDTRTAANPYGTNTGNAHPAPSCGPPPDSGEPCTCPGIETCGGSPQYLWIRCQEDGAWVETDASCLSSPTYTAWYCSPTRGPSPVTDSGADDAGDDATVCRSPSLCQAPMVQPPCPQGGALCPVSGWACVTPPGSSDAGDDGGPLPDGGVADAMGEQ
jgi:hypothetical protein